MTRSVLVPPERVGRWFENFASRHGRVTYATRAGRLVATAQDGAVAEVALPFGRALPDGAGPAELEQMLGEPFRWGVLLVRKGGFAVASGTTARLAYSKVGQRHVQGRTKAGGQSQQRFARRRDNQARQAYEAAAGHAHRILVTEFGGVSALVCGGDHPAVDAVLSDPRLSRVGDVRTEPWLPVQDPRRAVLDQAVIDARSAQIAITDPSPGGQE